MITPPVYTDLQGLSNLRSATADGRLSEEQQLEAAAEQFSAIFLQMALKSMRDASLGEGAMDSQQSEFYRDMFDKQLSLELSSAEGFGLTKLIVAQLSGNPAEQAQAYRRVDDLTATRQTSLSAQETGTTADMLPIDQGTTNEPLLLDSAQRERLSASAG